MAEIEVRGPDEHGDWFLVAVDGEQEATFTETYGTEAEAQAAAAAMRMKRFLGTVLPLSSESAAKDPGTKPGDERTVH
jgi:hypothetical protein